MLNEKRFDFYLQPNVDYSLENEILSDTISNPISITMSSTKLDAKYFLNTAS